MKHLGNKYLGLCVVGLSAISGCSVLPAPVSTKHFQFTTTVRVTGNDSVQSVESLYAATMLLWRPADGFAILGSDQLVSANQDVIASEKTNDSFENPESMLSTTAKKLKGDMGWGSAPQP